MKDMMFDDLSEFEALTDYESDWVDDTTKELLKQMGIEDVDGIWDDLFA